MRGCKIIMIMQNLHTFLFFLIHKTGSYHNYRQAARLWYKAKKLKVYIQKRKKLKLHQMKLATYIMERKAYW